MASGDMNTKFANWMRGRNGKDELSTCLILFALILVIINLFVNTIFLSIVAIALLAYAWFRMTSKNLEARENENGVFVEFLGPARPWVRDPVRAVQNRRKYRYFKCPNCKQRMRIPRGKGTCKVHCKNCDERFTVKS